MRLGVTREFVRQIEAKITRKVALSKSGRRLLDQLSALCASDAARLPVGLKECFGDYYSETVYLLRLYKASPFYDGARPEAATAAVNHKQEPPLSR